MWSWRMLLIIEKLAGDLLILCGIDDVESVEQDELEALFITRVEPSIASLSSPSSSSSSLFPLTIAV